MSFVIGKYCGITLALLYALSIAFHTALATVLSTEELIATLNIKGPYVYLRLLFLRVSLCVSSSKASFSSHAPPKKLSVASNPRANRTSTALGSGYEICSVFRKQKAMTPE